MPDDKDRLLGFCDLQNRHSINSRLIEDGFRTHNSSHSVRFIKVLINVKTALIS